MKDSSSGQAQRMRPGAKDLNSGLKNLLNKMKPNQLQDILAAVKGGGAVALLKDPEILSLLKQIGDPKQKVDPSSISPRTKIVLCEAVETLTEDNPSILESFGIKAGDVRFCR